MLGTVHLFILDMSSKCVTLIGLLTLRTFIPHKMYNGTIILEIVP